MELNNKVLQACLARIEEQLAPENHDNYMKIVVAGMRVALDKGPNGIAGSLLKSKDPVADSAKGAIGLVLGMRSEAKGAMPIQAMIPAAMSLMLKALDICDRAGIIKVTNVEVDKATKVFTDMMMQMFKITPQMLRHATGKVNQLAEDPAALQKMRLAAGFDRHPNAPTPTPLPEE